VERSSSIAILPSVTSSDRNTRCRTGSIVIVAHWEGVGKTSFPSCLNSLSQGHAPRLYGFCPANTRAAPATPTKIKMIAICEDSESAADRRWVSAGSSIKLRSPSRFAKRPQRLRALDEKDPNSCHSRMLRVRNERPSRHTADQRDELAAPGHGLPSQVPPAIIAGRNRRAQAV
jgi:hypothetical protein